MTLDDIGAVRQPAARATERARVRVVVGIEDPDDLAADTGQSRIDVLRLGDRPLDAEGLETRVAIRDCVQLLLDRQRGWRVVREDHLELREVLPEERLDGLNDVVRFVRKIRGDDRRCGRKLCGLVRQLRLPQCSESFGPDRRRSQREADHEHEVDDAGDVEADAVQRHVDAEWQDEARKLLGDDLQRRPRPSESPNEARAPRRLAGHGGLPQGRMQVELLRLSHHRDPGALLEHLEGDARRRVRIPDDRGQSHDCAGDHETARAEQSREPVEPDLPTLRGRGRHQNPDDAPDVADEVDVAAVLLDQRDDLRHDLVARPDAVPRLELGQLVDLQEREHTGAPSAFEPFQLVVDLTGERNGRECARDRIGDERAARNRPPLESYSKARDQLVGVWASRDDVVGPASERGHRQEPALPRRDDDDGHSFAVATRPDLVDQLERPGWLIRIGNVDHDQVRQNGRQLPPCFLRRADRRRDPAAPVDEVDKLGTTRTIGRHDQHVVEIPRVTVGRRRHDMGIRAG